MIHSALLAALLAGGANPAAVPAAPAEKVARARELIEKLGSDRFRERDKATRELRELGRAAVGVLQEAADRQRDPEVRARCEELLQLAEADDFAERLAAFKADREGKLEHDLPGWGPFRGVCGDDGAARGFYVELLGKAENRRLLAATTKPPAELGRAVVARRQELYARTQLPAMNAAGERDPRTVIQPVDFFALALAETMAPERHAPFFSMTQINTSNHLAMPATSRAWKENLPSGPPIKRLVEKWLVTRDNTTHLQSALNMARTNEADYTPGLPEAVAVGALGLDRLSATLKLNALSLLGWKRNQKTLPAVAKHLTDPTPIRVMPGAPEFRVQDAALCVALQLTDQKYDDYGLTITSNSYTMGSASYAAFTGAADEAAAKREAALKKWAEWAKANPDALGEAKP